MSTRPMLTCMAIRKKSLTTDTIQRNCLAPVLCYLHGYPIAVFGAGGTKDARKVLEPQFKRLIKRIKELFPGLRDRLAR